MTEVSESAATTRLTAAQRRTEAAAAAVLTRRGSDGKPSRILSEIRGYLEEAYNQKLIKESPNAVLGLVQMSEPIPDKVKKNVHRVIIFCGKKANFKNVDGTPRLTRFDGAWFDFRLTLEVQGNTTELIAFAFALRLPDNPDVWQVRFDLNGPGHANENLGLRSHSHLNVDDEGFSVPSPIMSPIELLDVFLFSLVGGKGKTRGTTSSTAPQTEPEPQPGSVLTEGGGGSVLTEGGGGVLASHETEAGEEA